MSDCWDGSNANAGVPGLCSVFWAGGANPKSPRPKSGIPAAGGPCFFSSSASCLLRDSASSLYSRALALKFSYALAPFLFCSFSFSSSAAISAGSLSDLPLAPASAVGRSAALIGMELRLEALCALIVMLWSCLQMSWIHSGGFSSVNLAHSFRVLLNSSCAKRSSMFAANSCEGALVRKAFRNVTHSPWSCSSSLIACCSLASFPAILSCFSFFSFRPLTFRR
mmetsp:Transcript_3216/g.11196  ORF Transcript_3216/g.11196 Transcript_3216/m.11196 type:complete len:224 (-) Transcript_3216:1729-2400(-)